MTEYKRAYIEKLIKSIKNETYLVEDRINHKIYFATERQLLKERFNNQEEDND